MNEAGQVIKMTFPALWPSYLLISFQRQSWAILYSPGRMGFGTICEGPHNSAVKSEHRSYPS